MVRAGSGGKYIDKFLSESVVAVGFNAGDLILPSSRDEIIQYIRSKSPNSKSGTIISDASQLNKFINIISVDDYVIAYDSIDRIYHYGKVNGLAKIDTLISGLEVNRSVKWIGSKSRDTLPVKFRNSLGSISTIFIISDDILEMIMNPSEVVDPNCIVQSNIPLSDDVVDEGNDYEDIELKGKELIKDKILALDFNELPKLFGEILKAMGYKVTVGGAGPDRGIDIFASPDGLGLELPRIKVEVKHRSETKIGAPLIRSFMGVLREGDRGIYVSTGGFAKDAHYEAERSSIPIALIDLDKMADLIINNYDKFDSNGRILMPLVKVYWPVTNEV